MANNPIKASDLYQDDGAILEAIKQWENLNKTIEEAMKKNIKLAIDLEVDIKKLNATQADHREEIKKSATAAEKLQKEQEKYTELLDESNVKIAALKNAQITLNQVHKAEAKLAAAKEGSYNALSAQYSLLKIRLNQMSAAERNATEEGKNLEKQAKEIYEEMKRLQEVTGKHTLSVGDYGKALRDLPGPLGSIKGGLDDFGGAMKALMRTPFLGLIGLIAGALVGLFQAFKKSANGAELLARIGGVLEGAFSVLVKIANDLAGVLLWAFEHPKEAVIALWQTIKTQVVERMKGVIDLFGAVGRAIFNAVTLNFGKMTEAAQDAGAALKTIFGGVVEYVKDVVVEVGKAADGFSDLAAKTLSVARANRELQKSVESLTTEEQVYQGVADDVTKSFKEREEAAEKARIATEKRAKLEIQIARNRLSLINQEINLRKGQDVERLLDEQLSAYQELAGAEREYTLAVQDNERTRAELKQDRLEKDLDILIDGFDNQKSINEKIIANTSLSEQKRRAILEETKRLSNSSFREQIATIQQFTGVHVDANDLIATSDAVLLNQKIRNLGLSEIIEGRLLEIVRDRKSANQDLAESEAALNESIRDERLKNLVDTQKSAAVEFNLVKRTEEEKAAFALEQRRQMLQSVLDLNDEFAGIEKIQVSQYNNEVKQANVELLAAAKQTAMEMFEQQQELKKSEFDLIKTTEREKSEFSLKSEKERLQKILELYGKELNETQKKTLENLIRKIDADILKGRENTPSLFELMGLKLDGGEEDALDSAFSYAKGQLTSFFNLQKQLADQRVQQSNDQVSQAQSALQAEIQLAELGYANRVETAQKDLALAKENQRKALNEQRKTQKAQLASDTIEQTSSLITAAAKVLKTVPFPFNLAAVGVMLGSFAAAKIKAFQLTKKEFAEGGLEFIGGGTHASGNDTPLGFSVDGKPAYAERGESHMILKPGPTTKYKSILPDLFKSLNSGTFEKVFAYQSAAAQHMPLVFNQQPTRMDRTENELARIRKQGETRTYTDGRGRTVEVKGNRKTVYL